jgi:hypothetical protein
MGGNRVIEHGVSGAKDNRPQLGRMLAAIRRKRFDAVVRGSWIRSAGRCGISCCCSMNCAPSTWGW